MSDLFDSEPSQKQPPPAPPQNRRPRALLITGGVLLASFFALTTFSAIYTDRLWFGSVGYTEVFSTLLTTRVLLFLVFGALMGAAVSVSMVVAHRLRPMFRPTSPEQNNLDRYRDAVAPIKTWLVVGSGLVVGAFAGASAIGQWREYLLWRNGRDFGTEDVYFNRDAGFYVFDLPFLHYLTDFVMATAIVALLAAVVVHYLYGGIRLQVQRDRFSPGAQIQLSVLLGIAVLAKAVDYYYDRFDLVNQNHALFTGMNNTAENAVLPGKNILIGVTIVVALLLFANVWRKTWQLPALGLGLFALSSVLVGMIWPAIVQQFQVNPSEADKEESYIQANIDSTTGAYGLSDVEYADYRGTPINPDTLGELTGESSTVPLVDPELVRETFQQRQQGRAYYSVAPVLDVDRYTIDGVERPLVLGARELRQSELADSDQNWSNLATVYTHGYGLIAAYANQFSADLSDDRDRIEWAEGIEDGQNALAEIDGEGYEPRIYFGEQSPNYSIVGQEDESTAVELSLPNTDPEEGDRRTTYDGADGVEIGSTFRQLLYAVKYGEPNFLLSGRVNGDSKVLYNRTPRERVQQVAPWLTLDSDPYPAVVNGKVLWIVDGYTTSDRFPNSQRESFETMTDDSLQQVTGLRTLPTDEINYMRNAVKATVDAFDGTTTLYAWDEEDPILQTWRDVFPGTVEEKSAIPDELMDHLRYPEDLFKVQRYLLAKYHVKDAAVFYQGADRWDVPPDPNEDTTLQPPYRLFANQDGDVDGASRWSLTSTFVPREKTNLASFVSVDSDALSDTYGRIKVLELTDANAPGPSQVSNEMSQDDDVRDELRDYLVSGATPPRYGNLLTLPVDDGLIYIQPIYAQRPGATTGSVGFPILQFVQVYYGGSVGIGDDLVSALRDVLGAAPLEPGQQPQTPDPDPEEEPDPNEPQQPQEPEDPLTVNEQIRDLLLEADDLFTQADEALSDGNAAKWARLTQQGRDRIADAAALASQRDAQGDTGNEQAEPNSN